MQRVGLIGFGYWGPNLARVLCQSTSCQFVACCDRDPRNLDRALRAYPQVRGFRDPSEMWDSVDAVVVATPISTHYTIACEALSRGKHVLVEKPIAHGASYAQELVSLADRNGCVLMTGHTFIYSPAVMKVKQLIESDALGDLYYLSLSRVNLGLYQKDVDVIWDLAVHDISILIYWLENMPTGGSAFGRCCVQQNKNDVAFLWFQFPGGVIASIEVSWLSPQKMRRTTLIGSKRMILYDDTEPADKVKVYDRGVSLQAPQSFGEFQLTYRTGDMVAPHVGNREPLLSEVEHFVECIESGKTPRTDGRFGLRVVEALEMVSSNMSSAKDVADPNLARIAMTPGAQP
jgi:predicted dehydrogenase